MEVKRIGTEVAEDGTVEVELDMTDEEEALFKGEAERLGVTVEEVIMDVIAKLVELENGE